MDTAQLLEDVRAFTRRYVVMTEAQRTGAALWIAHTHAFDAAEVTPYLSITSAEKESGKTRLLECLELLVARPWLTGRVTAAVLVRKIDAERPTLLLDESDAAFGADKEYAETLRGVLNTGYRAGGKASLCVGQGANLSYADFSTYGAKAIAGLGALPETVASRAIGLQLVRRAPGERVERFRRRTATAAAESIRARLEEWAAHHVGDLSGVEPDLPDALGDRAQDSWEPMLAIADLAGGEWPERARQAAVELSVPADAEGDSIGVRLLVSIREVFGDREKMASVALLDALNALEEEPWGGWSDGRGLTGRDLGRLLRPYRIRSRAVRLASENVKGFRREQFEDSWARYVPAPADPGDGGHTVTSQSPSGIPGGHTNGYNSDCDRYARPVRGRVTGSDPAPQAECDRVTAVTAE